MTCQKPMIVDKTKTWNLHDEKLVEQVSNNCKRIYGPEYCARVIEKVGENNYHIRCFNPKEDK